MAVRLSRNLAAAQDAFAKGNTEQLRSSHGAVPTMSAPTQIPEPAHKSCDLPLSFLSPVRTTIKDQMNKYGKGLIFGGTYSLVLLCFGGMPQTMRLALVNSLVVCVVSCGCFIAVSDYLGNSSDRELIKWERKRESWEYDNYLEGEQREMIELLEKKGVSHEDADQVIRTLSKYKEPFVDLMMIEELGLLAPLWTPLQHTPAIFDLYFHVAPHSPLTTEVYWKTITLAAASIFPLGCLRSYFMEGNKWWQPGVTEVANLALACALSFVLGGYVRPYI